MLDASVLGLVGKRLMGSDDVEVEGKLYRVGRTGRQRLSCFTFTVQGREYTSIEQNPDQTAPQPARRPRYLRIAIP